MDNEKASRLFKPQIVEQLNAYLGCDTKTERAILFPSVERIISDAAADGMCADILFHYVMVSLEYCRIRGGINIAPLFPNILEVIELIYPDKPVYARTLTQQAIITVSKMNEHFSKNVV
jgi:hypothetical protein